MANKAIPTPKYPRYTSSTTTSHKRTFRCTTRYTHSNDESNNAQIYTINNYHNTHVDVTSNIGATLTTLTFINHNQTTNNTLNNYHFTSFASKRDNSFSSSFFRFSSSSDTGKHSPHIHNGWSVIIAMNSFRLIPSLTSTFEFSARNRNALLLNNHNNNHFVTNSSGLAK